MITQLSYCIFNKEDIEPFKYHLDSVSFERSIEDKMCSKMNVSHGNKDPVKFIRDIRSFILYSKEYPEYFEQISYHLNDKNAAEFCIKFYTNNRYYFYSFIFTKERIVEENLYQLILKDTDYPFPFEDYPKWNLIFDISYEENCIYMNESISHLVDFEGLKNSNSLLLNDLFDKVDLIKDIHEFFYMKLRTIDKDIIRTMNSENRKQYIDLVFGIEGMIDRSIILDNSDGFIKQQEMESIIKLFNNQEKNQHREQIIYVQ